MDLVKIMTTHHPDTCAMIYEDQHGAAWCIRLSGSGLPVIQDDLFRNTARMAVLDLRRRQVYPDHRPGAARLCADHDGGYLQHQATGISRSRSYEGGGLPVMRQIMGKWP